MFWFKKLRLGHSITNLATASLAKYREKSGKFNMGKNADYLFFEQIEQIKKKLSRRH
jgi:hypothetical protein